MTGLQVTIHPGSDVLIPCGARWDSLRAPLAHLLQRPELLTAPLWADGVGLDTSAIVGERPLLAGALITTTPLPYSRWGRRERPAQEAHALNRDLNRGAGPSAGLRANAPSGPQQDTRLLPLLATLILPAAASVITAVATRQAMFALMSLTGLVASLPQVGSLGAARRGYPPRHQLIDPDRLERFTFAAMHVPDAAWLARTPQRASPNTLLPDRAIAIRGPCADVRPLARSLVCHLAAHGSRVLVRGSAPHPWQWCRWIAAPSPDTADLMILDAPTGTDIDAAACHYRDGGHVVVCLGVGQSAPSWCRDVIDIAGTPGVTGRAGRLGRSNSAGQVGRAGVTRRTGRAGRSKLWPGMSATQADRIARRLAALGTLGRSLTDNLSGPATGLLADSQAKPGSIGTKSVTVGRYGAGYSRTTGTLTDAGAAAVTDARLPHCVPLTDLISTKAPPHPGWAVPLGRDASGQPVTFDLLADGPHLLVAGTTGAGKSEALQALALALAANHSPHDLALVLVDFKGGASFGHCARLPQVIGQVSDLETGLAARALDGLRAEIRRRKQVLHRAGVIDMTALTPGLLPRLVVVFDEFRALADDLPDFIPGLLQVAAQGRSLGVHLILATQRPAGAISADMRANISARLSLRVVDAADSIDVIDSPVAAAIPAGLPGRAILRLGSTSPLPFQTAYAATPATRAKDQVTRPAPWCPLPCCTLTLPLQQQHLPHAPTKQQQTSPDAALVDTIRERYGNPDAPLWQAPWLPALPQHVDASTLNTPTLGAVPDRAATSLPFALGDLPADQQRTSVAWDTPQGHMACMGHSRSGRTTTLGTRAHRALAQGWHVHVLAPAASAQAFDLLRGHPGLGTLAGSDDPRRAGRLLRLLSQAPQPVTTLVVIDGLERLRDALADGPRDLLADGLACGFFQVAASADGPALSGLAPRFGPRLVLLSSDPSADIMLGAPQGFAGRGHCPGRAVWCGDGAAVECQVAMPPLSPPPPLLPPSLPVTSQPLTARHGRVHAPPGESTLVHAPLRILPLPRHVVSTDLPPSLPLPQHPGLPKQPGLVMLGVGGDDARPVGLDVSQGALVAGSRASGRSGTLRVILAGLAAADPSGLYLVTRDKGLQADAGQLGVPVAPPTGRGCGDLLAWLADSQQVAPARPLVIVDDVDVLAQGCPLEVDRLGDLAADGSLTVIASATSLSASMGHRGLVGHLRSLRCGVITDPAERGADDVFGTCLDDAVDLWCRIPGRAAIIDDTVVLPAQIFQVGA